MGIPSPNVMINAKKLICVETQIFGAITSFAEKSWCRAEMPRSPWKRLRMYFTYCTGMGSSYPSDTVEPGVLFGRPKIITNASADPVTEFKKNIMVGTSGSGSERGLRAAEMALSPPLIDDAAKNKGFLRDDARLQIVIVSDEEDSSQGAIDYFVDFYKSIKGYRNTSMLSFASIVGPEGGCNSSSGSAAPGLRYIEVANRLGGLMRSICTPDWGQIAEDLGLDAFGARREFFLTRQADPATIAVKVNGSAAPAADWTYDGTANSVIFAETKIPGAGATIEVRYSSTCPP